MRTYTAVVERDPDTGLFVGYIWAIGRSEDIRRVFRYHGAEHKTINAYEEGAELTMAEQLIERESIDTDELKEIVEANSPGPTIVPGTVTPSNLAGPGPN